MTSRLPAFALPVVSVVLALSGCVGARGAGDASLGEELAGGFDDTTGSIRGFVGTDDFVPIPGAQVGIAGTSLVGVTDANGEFTIGYVPPGAHALSAIALGHESGTRTVEVRAGATTDGVNFALAELPTVGPYHVSEIHNRIFGGVEWKLTPECMYLGGQGGSGSSTLKTCGGFSTQCEPELCEIHYGHCGDEGSPYARYGCDFTPDWKTIVAEVDWVQTSSVTGGGFSLEVLAPNVTRSNGDSGSVDQSDPHDFWKISSKPPIQWTIDDAALAARNLPPEDRCGGIDVEYPKCDWVWRIFATWCTVHGLSGGAAGCDKTGPDFGIMQDQPVVVYWSYFIRDPAPDGFTAIPDA